MIDSLIKSLYYFSFSLFGIHYSSNDIVGTILSLLDMKTVMSNKFELYKYVASVQQGIKAVALSLLTLFFIINLIKLLTQEGVERVLWERITLRACVFFLLKVFIDSADVSNGNSWIFAITNTMQSIYELVKNTIALPNVQGMNIADELIKIAEGAKFTDRLQYNVIYVILAIPYMATIIMILAQVTLRAVKLLIYLMFAPIPIAMAAEGETYRGKAINYFMSLCSICFEAIVIYIGTFIYSVGMNGMALNTASGGGKISTVIGIMFLNGFFAALIGISSQFSEKIFGRG